MYVLLLSRLVLSTRSSGSYAVRVEGDCAISRSLRAAKMYDCYQFGVILYFVHSWCAVSYPAHLGFGVLISVYLLCISFVATHHNYSTSSIYQYTSIYQAPL